MKKIFKKLNGFILCFLMLFSVAFIDIAKKTENLGAESSGYYIESSETYLNNVILSDEEIPSKYNLADYYPLMSENQKESSFCWIYASAKSLESAFMIQRNEFYNFSETALAYLDYAETAENFGSYATFNTGGNFIDFVRIYQDYGLVLESDFSNEEFADINYNTYKDYSYVKDLASTELNSIIKPYYISAHSGYTSVTNSAKIKIIKKFVKMYGSVFAGIEGSNVEGNEKGCFYTDNSAVNVTRDVYSFYDYDRASHKNEIAYTPLNENHAISLIGWNDDIEFGSEKGAFLAMNSWGYEQNSIRMFYIPYTYTRLLSECATFICEGDTETISIESASQSTFTSSILNSSKQIDNFFSYDDEIWINYNVDIESLDNLDIKISSGSRSFNSLFTITSDNETKTVKVKLSNTAGFYGGNYTIGFYNGGNLIGKRNIYIYSGTEINYLKSRTDLGRDTYGLDNASFNADNIVTFNVPSIKSSGGAGVYYLEFNRSPISSYNTILLSNKASQVIVKEHPMTISDVEIISSGNTSLETKYTQEQLISGLFREHVISEEGNLFRMQIGAQEGDTINLSEFNNCLIKFKFKVSSILYADCEKEYIVNLFISDRYSAKTSNLYSIFYNLNGGENNEGNITKYPRYSPVTGGDTIYDPNMTSFELLNPTKVGSVFSGWFLDEDFTTQIDRIDSSLYGNITLYAKWESLNTNYFDISLGLEGIKDYNQNSKNLNEQIIYGDSIILKFMFIRNSPLENNTYTIHYFFYGTDLIDAYFTETDIESIESSADKKGNKYFNLNFPKLKSGSHTFKIKVKVVINGILEVVEETSIAVNVEKKMVVFGFTELSKEYNGYNQVPTVSMVEDFYEEDYAIASHSDLYNLTCGVEAKNAGEYNFYISELLNNNYTFDANAESSKCVFNITKKVIELDWNDEFSPTYDGENHFPEYDVIGIVFGDSVAFGFNVNECKNAGIYSVYILPETITNNNYTVNPNSDFNFEFEIKKSKIKIIMHSVTDRVQTKLEKRAEPTFTVVGTYYSVDDLQLNISTEAFKATKSGNYTISCVVGNTNYEAEVEKATYTLTGYYNVYYQLSNGKTYTERVEEGKNPVGVSREQLGVSRFSRIEYSDDYLVTGSDIYVEVDCKDYSAIVYTGIIFVVGAVIIFIIYLKKRESGVR